MSTKAPPVSGTRAGSPLGIDPSPSRYDLVLLVIPAALLVSLFAGQLPSVSIESALAVGSIVGVLTLVDALFVNPPNGSD